LPAQGLTFSLTEAPAGMTIHPTTGAIAWTPTESQGPGQHGVTVRVIDNGTPALEHTTRFTVTVNEVNRAPALTPVGSQTLNEETALSLTVAVEDPDLPVQGLTFSLTEAPAGMTIHPTTGALSWTPTEAQGPGEHGVTVRVIDNGTPALEHTTRFTVTVNEVNRAPVLSTVGSQTLNEETSITVAVAVVDPDLPAQTLTFSLTEAPAGMTIHPTTGAMTWTPTESQGPGQHGVTVRVIDNGTPALEHTTRFTVTVNEVNRAPVMKAVPSATLHLGNSVAVTLSATDADLPAQTLTYTLVQGPVGATLSPTGLLEWFPTESSVGTVSDFTVRVTESGAAAQSDEETFRITVVGPLEILSTTVREGQCVLVWRAAAGNTYRIQSTSALPVVQWTVVPGDVTATGETASKAIVLDAGSVGSFFRVELVP
jgi:hypothetical protein